LSCRSLVLSAKTGKTGRATTSGPCRETREMLREGERYPAEPQGLLVASLRPCLPHVAVLVVLLDVCLLPKQLVYLDQRKALHTTSKHHALRFIHSCKDCASTCQSRPHLRHVTTPLLHNCRIRSGVRPATCAASFVVRYRSLILSSQSMPQPAGIVKLRYWPKSLKRPNAAAKQEGQP
jgi:hypothetical protein